MNLTCSRLGVLFALCLGGSTPTAAGANTPETALNELQAALDEAESGVAVEAGTAGTFLVRAGTCTFEVPGWGFDAPQPGKYGKKNRGFKHRTALVFHTDVPTITYDCDSPDAAGLAPTPFSGTVLHLPSRSAAGADAIAVAVGSLATVLEQQHKTDQGEMDAAVASLLDELLDTSAPLESTALSGVEESDGHNRWEIPGLAATWFDDEAHQLHLRFKRSNPQFSGELADQLLLGVENSGASVEGLDEAFMKYLHATTSASWEDLQTYEVLVARDGLRLGLWKRLPGDATGFSIDTTFHHAVHRKPGEDVLDDAFAEIGAGLCDRAFTYQRTVDDPLSYEESAGLMVMEVYALRNDHPAAYDALEALHPDLDGLDIARMYTGRVSAAVLDQCPRVRAGVISGFGTTVPEDSADQLEPIRQAIEREVRKAQTFDEMAAGLREQFANEVVEPAMPYVQRDPSKFLGFQAYMIEHSRPLRTFHIRLVADDLVRYEQTRGTSDESFVASKYAERLQKAPALEQLVTASGKPNSAEAQAARKKAREAAAERFVASITPAVPAPEAGEEPSKTAVKSPSDYTGPCPDRIQQYWHDRGWSPFGGPYVKTLNWEGAGSGWVDRVYTDPFVFVAVANEGTPLSVTLRSDERLITREGAKEKSSHVHGQADAVQFDGCQMVVLRDDARPEFDTTTLYETMNYEVRRKGGASPSRVYILPMRPNGVVPK